MVVQEIEESKEEIIDYNLPLDMQEIEAQPKPSWLTILSLNILSQKLVTGELPSYKWLYQNEDQREAYL